MSESSLKAVKRTTGKQSLITDIKKSGMIPGVFYGHGVKENLNIAAKELDLKPFIYTSESHVIDLAIEGDNTKYSCIIKDVQFDPVKYKPIHFDLIALSDENTIDLEIPVHLVGTPTGVRDEGGLLQHFIHKLEIQCLPKHIPSNIELNVEGLHMNESIKVGDIKLENIKILNDENASVVGVVPPQVQKEETPAEGLATDETKEPEVVAKGKKDKEE
ncbi:MAG TPA: 50S ribosomal protein L25 [Ignavibacteria bacterium]|nr:50S ribosomal protein L25 [Ignavibacteria bacterium]